MLNLCFSQGSYLIVLGLKAFCLFCLVTERKENGLEVDQQLKKAEAAQRRKMQVEKAARASEVWSSFTFSVEWLNQAYIIFFALIG